MAAVVLVAGCSANSAAEDPGAPASATLGAAPGPSTASAPHSTASEQETGMITYSVQGGFANQMRSVRIRPDGTAEADVSGRSTSGEMAAGDVARIVAELDASGLFDTDRTYSAPTNAADLQRYEIGYDGVTVVAYDTTVPPELTNAVSLLEVAIRDVARQ